MPSIDTRVEVAVGLVYPSGDLHAHLSDALRDLGASVVYEAETAQFDRAALDRSGAQVVIVNLDPDSDEQVDAIDDLLVDDHLKVVFNDGEVTSKLSGYDLARWARHLAAKIIGDTDLLPPRPKGAEAVPVRSMPQHALTTSDMPKSLDAPSVSDQSMLDATNAIADALASFDMHATKLEAKNTVAPATDDLSALLGDFGLAAPDASTPATASDDNPFAELGLELDFAAADAGAGVTPTETPAQTDAAPSSGSALADDLLAFADFNFDESAPASDVPLGLDDLLAQMPRTESAKPAPAPKSAANVAPAISPSSPRSDALAGMTLSLEPQDESPAAPAPAAVAVSVAEPAVVDFPFDLDGLTLEPLDEAGAAPMAAAPAAPARPAPVAVSVAASVDNPFADLGLSLEPLEDEAPAADIVAKPAPMAAAPAAAAPAAIPEPSPFDGLDFSLDDIPNAGMSDGEEVTRDEEFSFSLDDTVELSFEAPTSDLANSSQDEDDFMREFAALTAAPAATAVRAPSARTGAAPLRAWVLGASIGGPDAVREFLAALPPTVGATFILAQHMGADFVDLMVAQLQKATPMPVSMATSGMQVGPGQVLVVPIAERMLLDPSGTVDVVAPDDASPYSPSIDRVLIDIADRFGADAGAIIFSGMAHDAIEGAKHLAAKGGQVWVQDPSTCVVSSMIDGAMEAGIVGFIGAPAELAAEFVRRYGKA